MQGTAKRWEVITAYVRTRTEEEVLDMVKLGLKSRQSKAKADQFSIAKKRQANTSIKSDPTGRMESFTDVDVNISGTARCGLLFWTHISIKCDPTGCVESFPNVDINISRVTCCFFLYFAPRAGMLSK